MMRRRAGTPRLVRAPATRSPTIPAMTHVIPSVLPAWRWLGARRRVTAPAAQLQPRCPRVSRAGLSNPVMRAIWGLVDARAAEFEAASSSRGLLAIVEVLMHDDGRPRSAPRPSAARL